MNKIIIKFLLAGRTFTSEMQLTYPGFTYSTCERYAKTKERMQKLKEPEDWQYIYRNKLD